MITMMMMMINSTVCYIIFFYSFFFCRILKTNLVTKSPKEWRERKAWVLTCVEEVEEYHVVVVVVAEDEVEVCCLSVVISSPNGAAYGEILVIFYIRESMPRLYRTCCVHRQF